MTPGEAVMELSRIGFRFRLKGESVKVRFEGQETPDLAQVIPLIAMMKEHKEEVHFFLRCRCSECGGIVFGTFNGMSQCVACYWEKLAQLYHGITAAKH